MGLVQRLRRRWERYSGKGVTHLKELPDLRGVNAEIEFRRALEQMQATRVQFDRRSSSRPPPEAESTSISGLNARITVDDTLMKEALNELEEPPKD